MTIDALKKNAALLALAIKLRELIDETFPSDDVDEVLKTLLFEEEATINED